MDTPHFVAYVIGRLRSERPARGGSFESDGVGNGVGGDFGFGLRGLGAGGEEEENGECEI